MIFRKYEVNDMQEAMLKVKNDLGKDAVIVSTRKIKPKGVFGFLKKPILEVTAAVEDRKKDKKDNKDEFLSSLKNTQHMVALEEKLSILEGTLSKVYEEIKEAKFIKEEKESEYNNIIKLFYNNLINNEVEPDIVKDILDQANAILENDNKNINNVVRFVYNKIIDILGEPSPIDFLKKDKPIKIVLVGPTGVGKTTTIAKLTALAILNQKKKVGLITADTYRIAAVEQLRTYGEILGVPIKVVYNSSEVEKAIEQFSDKDIIFIDTAGRSHKNEKQFEELEDLMQKIKPDEIYLVLSITMKFKDMIHIIEKHNKLGSYKLIFTKVDETTSNGNIINICHATKKNLSYITTGQNVPDDIEVVDVENIVKSLLGSMET